ncbi:TPA: N-acetyltransferase family protein [Streptococcus pneumoniae]|nr:GNAT family N-acetyltransferase [Streptococcus pneumoniae]VJJ73220.1 acetyltransferase, gnat family [Streptococcus pneumoniae]VKC46697.1 acetyltransferase, gnat family [Streptococcus pneumoniae]VLH66945.1 acetyltransferase, gnat family [Streptococcus pneumoniae]VLP58167.1 acetyltransferase, gnat family [Streptococcus pneumoniae]
MTVIIKSMETPKEIEGKSLVHWQMWREAYDDLLPAEFQETMTLERCRLFSQKYPENTLIAIGDLKVVGFISYGNFRDETMQAGEIIALYVLKDYYGKGIAQKLMKAALTALNHFSEIFLWVLKDNKRAIAFYQKMGFTFDGQEKILELGKPIKEKRMVFYSKIILKSRSSWHWYQV